MENRNLPKIYAAGKVWHAPIFQTLRDTFGFNLTSRWIDIEGDGTRGEDFTYRGKPFAAENIWPYCLQDVLRADLMVIYCDKFDEEHRGVIMEAGHAMATGKPIFCINEARSFTNTVGVSDVAFTKHPLWNWIREPNQHIQPLEGFTMAVSQYLGVAELESNVIPGPWNEYIKQNHAG